MRLEDTPQRVVLNFTEPLNDRLSRVELFGPDGKEVPLSSHEASAERLVLRPRSELRSGAYRVRWHTVSTQDGHALEGTFSFGVRAAATAGGHQLEQSPLARAGWVRVAFRVLLYFSVLMFAAGVLLPLLLRHGGSSWVAPPALAAAPGIDADAVAGRERRVTGDLAWIAVAAAVGATVAEVADAAGGLSVGALRDFLLSNGAGLARVLVVASLLAAALVVGRRPAWAAACTTVALGGIAASGHASSAEPRVPSILNDWLHLVSGALWLGGIGLLMAVFAPILRRGGRPARRAVTRHVLPLFGRVALPAFLVVAATGAVSLLIQLGRLDALWTTAYGRVLLVKIGLVALIATASALHAWVLRPRLLGDSAQAPNPAERRHWRLLRAEPVVGLGVVAAIALLVSFPLPPRQLGDAGAALAAAPACDPCPLPEPGPDELAVADQAGSHVVAGWLGRDDRAVSGTIRILDLFGKPSKAPFEILGARQEDCGTGCRRFTRTAADTLRVRLEEEGRPYVAVLPAVWVSNSSRRAQRILQGAETAMSRLESVRQVELVTSGPQSHARTEYTLRAPNRMRFVTDRGVRTVTIGERQWMKTPDTPWLESSYGSGIPFSLRRWFRWTPYATAAQVLASRREDGRRVTELALMDPATPVWYRLVVDDATDRVLRERMVARGHFMRTRYEAFNEDLRVQAPKSG